MRLLKACVLIVFTTLMLLSLTLFVVAVSGRAVVGGAAVSLSSEKGISVPVTITNNPGLMGFKISVAYSSDVILLESVEQGSITKSGNFSTKTDSESSVTILWNNTNQVTDDGSLFILNFAVLDSSKNGKLTFSFSEEDTFNEEYENVPITFEEIDLIASDDSEDPSAEPPASTVTSRSEQTPETNSPADTPVYPTRQKTEQDSRIDAAVAEIKNNFSDSEIESIISNSLKEIDSSSIEMIPSGMIEAFAGDVREQLAIDGVEKINELNDDELLSALEQIINESKPEAASEEPDAADDKTDNQVLIVIAIIFAFLILSVSAVAIIKNVKKNSHIEEEK